MTGVLNSSRKWSPFLLHQIAVSLKDFFIIFRHHSFLLEWPFLKVKESINTNAPPSFFFFFSWVGLLSVRIIDTSSPWTLLRLLAHFLSLKSVNMTTFDLLSLELLVRFWSNDLEVQNQYWGAILLLFLLQLACKILNKQYSPVLFLPCLSLTVHKGLVQSPLKTGIEKGRNSYVLIRNKINYYF